MKVSAEILFHYRCDRCNKWWSVADIPPFAIVHCPHCGHLNHVAEVNYPVASGLSDEKVERLASLLEKFTESMKNTMTSSNSMATSQYSLSLDSLRGLNESETAQSVAKWIRDCSSSLVSTEIDKEALEQIKFYESKYRMSSTDIKLQAETQEFIDNQDISHWLMLIESYPECLADNQDGDS